MKYHFKFKPLAVSIGLFFVLTHTGLAAEEEYPGINIVNGKAEINKGKIAQIKAEAESADQYIIDLINNISLTEGPQGDQGPAGIDGAENLPDYPEANTGIYHLSLDTSTDTLSWVSLGTSYPIGETGPAGGGLCFIPAMVVYTVWKQHQKTRAQQFGVIVQG